MRAIQLAIALTAMLALGGCEVIATIFEAGMWVGIIIVVAVLALVGLVVSRFRR